MMFDACKNSKKQGEIGMAHAIAYYTQIGWVVSIPLCDNQDYDLVVDTGSSLLKVQVKTTKYKSKYGVYICSLQTCGGNSTRMNRKAFDSKLVDLLFVLTEIGAKYSIPTNKIEATTSLSLNVELDSFKIG